MSQHRPVFRVIVLTTATVAFPFPGEEPEINFIARIHDDHVPPKDYPQGYEPSDPRWWRGERIVPVVIGSNVQSLPAVGSEVSVKEYDDFYRGRGERQASRLCLFA